MLSGLTRSDSAAAARVASRHTTLLSCTTSEKHVQLTKSPVRRATRGRLDTDKTTCSDRRAASESGQASNTANQTAAAFSSFTLVSCRQMRRRPLRNTNGNEQGSCPSLLLRQLIGATYSCSSPSPSNRNRNRPPILACVLLTCDGPCSPFVP
jgi:hypothetical protein